MFQSFERFIGIEAAYDLSGERWRLRAGAIYQEPEDRNTRTPLLRRAKENFTLAYAHRFGALELGIDALAAGKRPDFDTTLDSYVLTNMTVAYTLGDHWSLQARVENLFDEEYTLASGYATQDRNVFVGVRYR